MIALQLRERIRRNTVATFAAQRARFLPHRKPRLVSEWAEAERWIAQGASPLSSAGDIRFRGDVMPWMAEPSDSAMDPDVQVTVLWFASALGKTEIAANIIGHSIAEEPKNIFVAYPKDESRDKFSRDVLQRSIIDATPSVRDLVAHHRNRDGGNSLSFKRFTGGSVFLVGAGSAANFRGPRAGVVYCDEIDGMPDDVAGEGDPISLAFRRAEGFAGSIKLLSGTGTFKAASLENGKKLYRSKIHQWFDQSDQRKWFCPCRVCGEWQVLTFEQVRRLRDRPEVAYYLCAQCDADHSDRQRVEMVRAGQWRATAPFAGIRGYWINGVNSTLPAEKGFRTKMHQFVDDADRAALDRLSKRVWINTFLAELDDPSEQTEDPPKWQPLFDRREPYDAQRLPYRALVITGAVDVQMDRLEVLWTAWGRGEESWIVDHEVIPGPTQDTHIWGELERTLRRVFKRQDDRTLGLSRAFVDAGKWPEWVGYFLSMLANQGSPLRGIIRACRGSSQCPHPIIDTNYTRLAKQVQGHWVGTDAAKDLIYSRLRRPLPADGVLPEGWQHFPTTLEEKFFEQLTTERVTITFQRGEEIRRYINADRQRNETLDLSVYCLAAFKLRRWNFDVIEAELQKQNQPPKEPPPTGRNPAVRRSTFVSNWR